MASGILPFLSLLPFLPTLTVGGIPFSFIKLSAVAIFVWWCARGLFQRRILIPFSPILFLSAGFVGVGVISMLWARDPVLSLHKAVVWLSLFPLMVVLRGQLCVQATLYRTLHGLAAVSGMLAFVSILQFFAQFVFGVETTQNFFAVHLTPLFVGVPAAEVISQNSSWLVNIGGTTLLRAVAVFPDPHTLALFLGLAVPFALFASITASDTKQKRMYAVIVVMLGSALLLTFSRGAYLALLASGAVLLLLLRPQLNIRFKKQIAFAGGVVLIVVLMFGQPVVSRLVSSFNTQEGSNAGRLAIWNATLETIASHPFLGVGLGNYPLTQDALAAPRSPINAHNTYLEIAAETGIVGLVLWLGIFIVSFFVLWRTLAIKNDYNEYVLAVAVLAALVFYCVQAIFETVIYSPPNLVLLSLILALVMREDNKKSSPSV